MISSIDICIMRFKDYIKLDEEQSGTDRGMMGFGVPAKETQNRAPSDGQPFADKLKSTAGARPNQGGGGMAPTGMNAMGAGGMFMKKMKKKMKKN